jgi:predicted TIM-barrel fold metal-dependent hydrolase
MSAAFDIVDAQLHMGRGRIEATLAAMDALGITGVVIDEFWGSFGASDPTHIDPGFALPNGAWRATSPTAETAGALHPDRFAYLVRVDRRDPDLDSVMRLAGQAPHARAVRIQPVWTLDEARAFADGAYEELFRLADREGLPVFAFIPGFVELLAPYLQKFRGVTLVIDHCGMPFTGITPVTPEAERLGLGYFDQVLKVADHPNAALKWAHANARFGVRDYPFEGLRPYLARAVAAFGADRVMWASDETVIPDQTWSDLLHAVRDDPDLKPEDKAWVLGATARRVLDWRKGG